MPPNPPSLREVLTTSIWLLAYEVAGILALLTAVLAWPLLARRGYRTGIAERLGQLPPALLGLRARPVWIHAASVGEARAARSLVTRVRREHPGIPVVVSTTTTTGRAVAQSDLAPDAVTLLPIDALGIIDRALRRVRPRCLVLIETEIWPGLLRAAERASAPVVMLSGRLSPRAARRYRWMAPLLRAALRRVSRFGMQSQADAERIIALGAPRERVEVTGSLKHGAPLTERAGSPLDGLDGRRLLVAASTHPGEESFVLAACRELWAERHDLLLLIAPRRPERFDEVEGLVAGSGVRYQRRSRSDGAVAKETQVLVLDTIGELTHFYPDSVAVFVGGTVAPVGGHNLLEPAAYGAPVAFGPNTANVPEAAAALRRSGGGLEVHTPSDLGQLWRRLLTCPADRREMGERARQAIESGAAAVDRNWALLEPFVKEVGTTDEHG